MKVWERSPYDKEQLVRRSNEDDTIIIIKEQKKKNIGEQKWTEPAL